MSLQNQAKVDAQDRTGELQSLVGDSTRSFEPQLASQLQQAEANLSQQAEALKAKLKRALALRFLS